LDLIKLVQGLPERQQRGKFAPGPQLKGAANFKKGGRAKGVIKKNYLERFLYK
jgi:hypothetical protein